MSNLIVRQVVDLLQIKYIFVILWKEKWIKIDRCKLINRKYFIRRYMVQIGISEIKNDI